MSTLINKQKVFIFTDLLLRKAWMTTGDNVAKNSFITNCGSVSSERSSVLLGVFSCGGIISGMETNYFSWIKYF